MGLGGLGDEEVEDITELYTAAFQQGLERSQEVIQVEVHLRLQLCTLVQASLELIQGYLAETLGVKVREQGIDFVLLHRLEGRSN